MINVMEFFGIFW